MDEQEKLTDATLVDGSDTPRANPRRGRRWLIAGIALALLAVLGVGMFFFSGRIQIAKPKYPEMPPYPIAAEGQTHYTMEEYEKKEAIYDKWLAYVSQQVENLEDISALRPFFAQSTQAILTGAGEENRIYSPLNVYMCLSMLAQITDGESREQILTALGSDDMDALRQQAKSVWNASYRDDGLTTTLLASSLWLNEDVPFHRNTVNLLAKDFYASVYRGEMGSERMNQAFQDWLNSSTGEKLNDQVQRMNLAKDTALALATTLNFEGTWEDPFSEQRTEPMIFHAPTGDTKTDFMYRGDYENFFWGEKFTAVALGIQESGTMWIVLPDEGITPEDLLSDGETMEFLFGSRQQPWENQEYLLVKKTIPKFDVSSHLDIAENLKVLGIIEAFDRNLADFSPLTSSPVYVNAVDHAARVSIDEEGCSAAAFTVTELKAAGMPDFPDGEVDFIADRPFIFCITGVDRLPLFVGIVNNP